MTALVAAPPPRGMAMKAGVRLAQIPFTAERVLAAIEVAR